MLFGKKKKIKPFSLDISFEVIFLSPTEILFFHTKVCELSMGPMKCLTKDNIQNAWEEIESIDWDNAKSVSIKISGTMGEKIINKEYKTPYDFKDFLKKKGFKIVTEQEQTQKRAHS